MSSKCSLITSKEVADIGNLFSEFLTNNLNVSNLKNLEAFIKNNLDDFFNNHLGQHIFDQTGRVLTQAEKDFIHSTLISLSGSKQVFFNSLLKSKAKREYYEVDEKVAKNALSFTKGIGMYLDEYTISDIPKIDTLLSRLGTPTEETGLAIPRVSINTPTVVKLVSAQKITKFTDLKNPADISKAFMGSLSAQIVMEKVMHLNIVRRFMVNKKEGIYNTSNQDIDSTIKTYKEEIFKEVVDYVKEKQNTGLTFDPSDNQLYVYNESGNTILNPNFRQILDKVKFYYSDIINVQNTTLEAWKNTDDLRKYVDFIIIANFDSILLDRGKEVFSISDSLFNSDSETKEQLKYSLNVKNKMSSFTFSTQESFLLLEEQSALYKMLLGAMPFITKNGDVSIVKEIDISSINGSIAKMFSLLSQQADNEPSKSIPRYDKRNPLNSMKEVFEYVVKEYTNPKAFRTLPKELMGPELDLVLSLYINFFRSNDSHKLISILGKNLYEKLTTPKPELKNTSVLEYIGPSYYQLGANTFRIKKDFGLDYTSVIVSNFDKTYFNNYTEVVYDPVIKDLTINTPDSKIYEGDIAALRNNINTVSNYKFSDELLAKDLLTNDHINIDYNTGIVKLLDIGTNGNRKDLIINIGETGTTSVKIAVHTDKGIVSKDFNSKEITDPEIADILTPNSKFIQLVDKNLPSVNIATNSLLLESIRLVFDEKNNGVRNTISALARLTAGSIFVKKLSSETKNVDKALDKSKFLKKRKGDSFGIINTKRNEISVTSLNSLYGELVNRVGQAVTMSNGSMYRAVTKVANGTTMPLHGQVRHLYTIKDLVKSLIEDNEGKTKGLPLESNFFVVNQHMITPSTINTYIKNGDQIKHSSELTPQELAYDSIVNKYYGAMFKYDGKVFIQPTVFTDKNTHNALAVNLNTNVHIDTITKKHSDVALMDMSMETIKGAMFNSNYKYYRNLGKRLKLPYENAINEYRRRKGLEEVKISDINPIKQIHNLLRDIPINDFRKSFYFANGSRFGLIEDLGISKYKGEDGAYIGLSETLVHFSEIYAAPEKGTDYTEKFDQLLKENLDAYAKNLNGFGVKIQFVKRGRADEILESALTNLFPDITLANFVQNWVDGGGNLIIQNKSGEVNPLIEHFFWMDNFISDSFQQVSMGTIHNHPTKGNIDKKKDRMTQVISLKTAMNFKRQLQGTPMTPFLHKVINGIPDKTKTVYLSEIEKSVFNSFWNRDNMKTSDGMSITPMLQIILQNNSLLDNKVGVNMKTLGLSIDPYYNSFGLMKHAEFGATNEWVRRSAGNQYDLRKLYEQAYGIPINTSLSSGKQYIPNLLKDFNKRDITIKDIAPQGLFFTNEKGEVIEVTGFTHSTAITDQEGNIISGSKGSYSFEYHNKTTNEKVTNPVVVNTLNDLWIALGAENSISLDPEGNIKDSNNETYVYSDSSHFALADFVNRIGVHLNNDGKKYLREQGFNDADISELVGKPFGDFDKSEIIATQNTVWQPLKSKFIGKYVFSSAQKSGASSILPIEYAFNKELLKQETGQDVIINTEVSMLSTGVLMDADHHVENSEITEMSQIISALIFNGDTYPIAKDAYNSLAAVVHKKLKTLVDGIAEAKQIQNKDKLYREVTKLLIRTFEAQKQKSIATFLADLAKKDMLNSANTRNQVNEQVAIEASSESNEEEGISNLLTSYTETGSKLPFSVYIYGSFISLLSNHLNKEAIKRKHPGIASVLKPSAGIVQVYDTIDGRVITSDIFKRAPIIEYQPVDAQDISLFDWATNLLGQEVYIDTPAKLIDFKKNNKGQVKKIYGKPRDLKPVEVKFTIEGTTKKMSIYDTEEYGIIHSTINIFEQGNIEEKLPVLLKKEGITNKQLLDILAPYFPGITIKALTTKFLFDNKVKISQIFKNKIQSIFRELENNNRIKINGVFYNVSNVETIAGEALGPNIYREQFGLPKGISPTEVNKDKFVEILKKNSLPETQDSNWFVRNINGKHVYVFTRSQYEKFKTNFSEQNVNISEIDGERWVVDEFGDKDYKISDLEFYKYRTNGGKVLDAVVVDDLDTELKSLRTMMFSKGKNTSELIINDDLSVKQSLLDIDKKANDMYSSFLLSLEFSSARIPGQGPQSFTPLKLVDFINTESNTIMTNHFTSWLKGEDYDIDKGFWMGVSFTDGKFVGWSSWFDYRSLEALQNSTLLPMPDGKTRIFVDFENADLVISKEEYEDLVNYRIFKQEITTSVAKTMSKLSRVNTFHVIGLSPDDVEGFNNHVNEFFTEELSEDIIDKMVKNKVSRSIFEMIKAPVNQVHAESPIDLGDPQRAALKASSEVINNYNPGTKPLLQNANMVGKEVIGIAAVGLKVWSALSYWGNSKIESGNFQDIILNKEVVVNGKKYTFPTIANLNFNNEVKSVIDNNYLKKYKSIHPETAKIPDAQLKETLENQQNSKKYDEFFEFVITSLQESPSNIEKIVEQTRERFNLNVDQSLTLSALLSAATDNAKELILAKINAGPDTAGVYAYLTMLGVPFTEISDMMTSDNIKWVVTNSKSNIFDKNTTGRNIKNTIKKFIDGPNIFTSISDMTKIYTIEDWARRIIVQNVETLGIDEEGKSMLFWNGKIPPARVFSFNTLRLLTKNNPTKIKAILALLSSKIPETLDPVSSGSMSEEEAEMASENFGDSGESYSKSLRVNTDIFNLLAEFNIYIEKTGIPTDEDISSMLEFSEIYNSAQEIAMLGRILGINQGVRTDPYGQYSFYEGVNSFVKNRLSELAKVVVYNGTEYTFNSSSKTFVDNDNNVLKDISGAIPKIEYIQDNLGMDKYTKYLAEFSFEAFLKSSPEEKQEYINAYNQIKYTLNILDVIESVPHFKAMLEVPIVVEEVKDALTVKSRMIKKLIGEVYATEIISPKEVADALNEEPVVTIYPKISDKNFAKLSAFCDDILIVKWLRGLKDDQRTITYSANGEYQTIDGKLQYVEFPDKLTDITLDIGTVEGRRNFIEMFHNLILSLKRDERYTNNNFIQSLMIDWKEDPLTGREYQFYRLPINLLTINEHTRSLYNSYVSGFNDLDGDMVEGTALSLKDMIFLYDTIINRTKVNRTSFAKLFEEDNNRSKQSLVFDYIDTISKLDFEGEEILSTVDTIDQADYDPDDLITKGFAERIFTYDLDTYKGKYTYAILIDDNDNKYTQYYRWDVDAKTYEEYPHFADSLSIPLKSNSVLSTELQSENRSYLMNAIKKLLSLGNKINFKIEC